MLYRPAAKRRASGSTVLSLSLPRTGTAVPSCPASSGPTMCLRARACLVEALRQTISYGWNCGPATLTIFVLTAGFDLRWTRVTHLQPPPSKTRNNRFTVDTLRVEASCSPPLELPLGWVEFILSFFAGIIFRQRRQCP
jgi:hypothetical protein